MKTIYFCFCFTIFTFTSFGQNNQKYTDWLNANPALKTANIACGFYNLNTNSYVFKKGVDKLMAPASTLKILTTATAYGLLGKNYQYLTKVYTTGTVQNEVLDGDLIIQGVGDPTFGSNRVLENNSSQVLQKIQQALHQQNIKKITGKIIIDISNFETAVAGRQWTWEDLGNYYGGGAWGLNFHENEYYIYLNQNPTPGKLVTINRHEPTIPALELISELKTGKKNSGDNAYIFGAPYTYYKHIRGTIPPGNGDFKIKGAIPEPPYFFGYQLKDYLIQQNILVEGKITISHEPKPAGKELINFQSPPLKEIISLTNKKSINLYAEALLKTIGLEKMNFGSTENGMKLMSEFWKSKGLNLENCRLDDASGLSPSNLISPRHYIDLLKIIHSDKVFLDFKKSLAIAGTDGTFKYFLKATKFQGKLIGKSGSIANCRNYVGYLKNYKGEDIAFAIMLNNYAEKKSRQQIERLIKAMF